MTGGDAMSELLGYRIVGPCCGERRLVDWLAAFSAYASLDDRAEVHREAYLSAFTFGADFRTHLAAHGTTKGFDKVCGAEYIWFDIDREQDLEAARRDAARLCLHLVEFFGILDDLPLIWFSGAKGFHVGLPTALWAPVPSVMFNRVARRFAECLASGVSVAIDSGVYDKVRAFRAPNSRHGKTGLHKLGLSLEELVHLSVGRIQQIAQTPRPFDLPSVTGGNLRAAAEWRAAVSTVDAEDRATTERVTVGGSARLTRSTLDFIRNGASPGDRHRLLFSAAANLAEFACPENLAHELLTDAALDSGLSPADVRRQIECGLSHLIKRIS